MATKSKSKEKESVVELPDPGVYTLQVLDIQFKPDQVDTFDGNEVVRDKVQIDLELVGTKNPEKDDDPFTTRITVAAGKGPLVSTRRMRVNGEKRETQTKTNAAKFLEGFGYTVPSGKTIRQVNWLGLLDMFTSGYVEPNDKGYLNTNVDTLKPPRDAQHMTYNNQHMSALNEKSPF